MRIKPSSHEMSVLAPSFKNVLLIVFAFSQYFQIFLSKNTREHYIENVLSKVLGEG